MNIFVIVKVNPDYCEYLRRYDKRVYYNSDFKDTRPFIGVLFEIENIEYFAPLSSPKSKHIKMHSSMDFIKIDGGKLGVINLNNMIPIKKGLYNIINLNDFPTDKKSQSYYYLLNKQYKWINSHGIQITKKSKRLYDLYIQNKLPSNIKNRCCNFKLLEEKCYIYDEVLI